MRWRIYYGDGSVFSDADGSPEDAPAANIQIIVQDDPVVGRYLLSQKDYYFFREGQWYGSDLFGMIEHFQLTGELKTGRSVSNEQYDAIQKRAIEDPGFNPKSGWRVEE